MALVKKDLHWTKQDWSKVLWSDESKYDLFSSDGSKYDRCPKNKKEYPWCTTPTVKHGNGSFCVCLKQRKYNFIWYLIYL